MESKNKQTTGQLDNRTTISAIIKWHKKFESKKMQPNKQKQRNQQQRAEPSRTEYLLHRETNPLAK